MEKNIIPETFFVRKKYCIWLSFEHMGLVGTGHIVYIETKVLQCFQKSLRHNSFIGMNYPFLMFMYEVYLWRDAVKQYMTT